VPLYEYECLQCGDKFEVRRGFFDRSVEPKCPKCKSEHTMRVFSPVKTCSSGSAGTCVLTPTRRFG